MKRTYKTEMKMLKEHRKLYLPAVMTLLNYYNNKQKYNEHIEFKDTSQMLILAELVDIGYLNPKVVVIDKYFESIDKVFYTLEYPLTEKGDVFYHNEIKNQQNIFYKKRNLWLILITIIVLLVGIACYFFFKN